GGWKRSTVGTSVKAGGPNYLIPLTDWETAPARVEAALAPRVERFVAEAARVAGTDSEYVRRAAGSDAAAWRDEFGAVRDVSGLAAERNWLRYLPVPVWVRDAGDRPPAELLRVVMAGLLAGSAMRVSTARVLAAELTGLLMRTGVPVHLESDDEWVAAVQREVPSRVRLIGGDAAAFAAAIGGRADVAVYAQLVVEAGRVELLTFLREQSISMTAHRFGTPSPVADQVVTNGVRPHL